MILNYIILIVTSVLVGAGLISAPVGAQLSINEPVNLVINADESPGMQNFSNPAADFKYVDPRRQDNSESFWRYDDNSTRDGWKHKDVRKEEIRQRENVLENVISNEEIYKEDVTATDGKNYKERLKSKDLKFKPAKIIKEDSLRNRGEERSY